jgi:hypothetical protein
MLRLASPSTVHLEYSEERKPMNDSDSDHRQAVALFRYGLIADLVRLEPGSKGLYAQIEQKAAGEYTIPGSTRTRVAAETLRDWLNAIGAAALMPGCRSSVPLRPVALPAQSSMCACVNLTFATQAGFC